MLNLCWSISRLVGVIILKVGYAPIYLVIPLELFKWKNLVEQIVVLHTRTDQMSNVHFDRVRNEQRMNALYCSPLFTIKWWAKVISRFES